MKTPVLLLANDLHVDKACVDDFVFNWDEMVEQAEKHSIGTICIGGDLFTNRSAQTLNVLMAVKKCIEHAESKGINLVIALGNHDLTDQAVTYGYPSLYDSHKNVTIVNDGAFFIPLNPGHGKIHLAIMRYWNENTMFCDKMECLKDELSRMGISPADVILYVHEGIHGGLGNLEAKLEVPQSAFKGFKYVLSGHYHNRIKVEGANIEYIGSTRQKDFGEDENKGYTIVYDDGSYSFIQNQVNMRYVTLKQPYSAINEAFIDKIKDYVDDGYYVKLKISCTESERKSIDKEELYSAGVVKIDYDTEEAVVAQITNDDLSKKYDNNGIKTEYSSFCSNNEKSSDLGIKYLNKALV